MQDPTMGGAGAAGDASFTGGGQDPMAGGMQDPMAGGNEPVMGSDPFGGAPESDVTDDPEKKVESLIGQASSIIRKDLNSDGINKHEDKKKEVLGMLVSAITDGMDDEERNGIIDYLSDKVNGSGESDGDTDGGSEDTSMETQGGDGMDHGMDQDMDQDMGQDAGMQQDGGQAPMLEKIVNEITNGILDRTARDSKKNGNPKSNVGGRKTRKQGYSHEPFIRK